MEKQNKLNKPEHQGARQSLLADNQGLSTVEYVILLVLIVVAGIGLWQNFGDALDTRISNATSSVNDMGK